MESMLNLRGTKLKILFKIYFIFLYFGCLLAPLFASSSYEIDYKQFKEEAKKKNFDLKYLEVYPSEDVSEFKSNQKKHSCVKNPTLCPSFGYFIDALGVDPKYTKVIMYDPKHFLSKMNLRIDPVEEKNLLEPISGPVSNEYMPKYFPGFNPVLNLDPAFSRGEQERIKKALILIKMALNSKQYLFTLAEPKNFAAINPYIKRDMNTYIQKLRSNGVFGGDPYEAPFVAKNFFEYKFPFLYDLNVISELASKADYPEGFKGPEDWYLQSLYSRANNSGFQDWLKKENIAWPYGLLNSKLALKPVPDTGFAVYQALQIYSKKLNILKGNKSDKAAHVEYDESDKTYSNPHVYLNYGAKLADGLHSVLPIVLLHAIIHTMGYRYHLYVYDPVQIFADYLFTIVYVTNRFPKINRKCYESEEAAKKNEWNNC